MRGSSAFFLILASASASASTVPAGFEALLTGQSVQLDVQVLGQSLGLYPVLVKTDSVTLSNPEAIMKSAPLRPLTEQEKDILLSALSRPLPRNGQLACGEAAVAGCGFIATRDAAVIFNESQGILQLFINPEWLASTQQSTLWFSPTASAQSAFIHQQMINFSGERSSQSLSVSGNGSLGLGEGRYLAGDWVVTQNRRHGASEQQQWVNNLYARQDIDLRHYIQGGRMDQRNLYGPLGGNFSFTLLPLVDLYGLRVGSSEAYVNAAQDTNATPLMVQVNSSARVDIFRGNQLLSSQYLSAGLQPLNTDMLPPGSYTVELRVFEGGVLQRTEQRPFSKTGAGFSARPQWFVQAGEPVKDDGQGYGGKGDKRQSATGVAGVTLNLLNILQMTSGVSAAGGSVYNETRMDTRQSFTFGELDVNGSILTGNDGSRGSTQQLTYSDGFSASLYRYQVRGSGCKKAGEQQDEPLVSGCYTTLSASLSVPVAGWSAMLSYSDTQNDGRTVKYEYPSAGGQYADMTYATPVTHSRNWQLGLSRAFSWSGIAASLQAGMFRNRGDGVTDEGGFMGLTLSRASQPPVTSGSDSYTSLGMNWRGGNDSQLSWDMNHTRMWQQDPVYRELAVNVSGYNADSMTGSFSGRASGRYGDLSGTLSENHQHSGGDVQSLTGSYASSFALSREGMFWGGEGTSEPSGGVVLRVADSEDTGSVAKVSGAGAHAVQMGFGEKMLIPLTGYTQQQVAISDSRSTTHGAVAGVTMGSGEKSYFLQPGHLVVREIDARLTWTWIGQAVDLNGQALKGAQVLNQSIPELDESGQFTLQSETRIKALWLLRNGQLLRCPLEVRSTRDILQIVGQTVCVPAAEEGLPQALKLSPRVIRLLGTASLNLPKKKVV